MKRLIPLLTAVTLALFTGAAIAQQLDQLDLLGRVQSDRYGLGSIVVDGDYGYVGNREEGLLVFSTASLPNLLQIAHIDVPCLNIVKQGDYLFSTGDWGINVIDVSHPNDPRQVAEYREPNEYSQELAIAGNYLYAAACGAILVLDITDPLNPVRAGFQLLPWRQQGLEAGDSIDKLVIASEGRMIGGKSGGGMWLFDISNPIAPTVIQDVEFWGPVHDIVVDGSFIYAAVNYWGVGVFEMTDDNIQMIDTVVTDDWRENGHLLFAGGLAKVDDYLYVTQGRFTNGDYREGHLSTIDISDPTSAVIAGDYTLPCWFRSVRPAGNHLIVSGDESSLYVIDNTDPTALVACGYFGGYRMIVDFELRGEKLYAADKDFGVRVLDVTIPSMPTQVFAAGEGTGTGVGFMGDYAVISADSEIAVYDLRPGAGDRPIGTLTTMDAPTTLTVKDNIAYVGTWHGLELIDLSNPIRPTPLGDMGTCITPRQIEVVDQTLYMLSGGLHTVDVSDPSAPQHLCYMQQYGLTGMAIQNNIAYLVGQRGWDHDSPGFMPVDISDPTNPQVLNNLLIGENLLAVAVEGNYCFVGVEYGTLYTFDITDPETPVKLDEMRVGERITSLLARDGKLYVGIGNGIAIYQFTGPNGVKERKPASVNGSGLLTAYPNPFNGTARIRWMAQTGEPTSLEIYDLTGGMVKEVFKGKSATTLNEVSFLADALPTGTYYLRLNVGGKLQIQPMRLIR